MLDAKDKEWIVRQIHARASTTAKLTSLAICESNLRKFRAQINSELELLEQHSSFYHTYHYQLYLQLRGSINLLIRDIERAGLCDYTMEVTQDGEIQKIPFEEFKSELRYGNKAGDDEKEYTTD